MVMFCIFLLFLFGDSSVFRAVWLWVLEFTGEHYFIDKTVNFVKG